MTELFKVTIPGQRYDSLELTPLAELLKVEAGRLQTRLAQQDLIIKQNVDELTAQRYAAVIYQKTGIQPLVHPLPAIEQAATEKNLPWGKWIACAVVIVLVALGLKGWLHYRSQPEYALRKLQHAVIEADASTWARYADSARLFETLATALVLPARAVYLQPAGSALIASDQATLYRSLAQQSQQWFEQGESVAPVLGQASLRGFLQALNLRRLLTAGFAVEIDGDTAVARTEWWQNGLDMIVPVQLTLRRIGSHWQLVEWSNAAEFIDMIAAREQIRLETVNRQIAQSIQQSVTDFAYQSTISGAHKFSRGDLDIQASLTNASDKRIATMTGTLTVFGLDSGKVYAVETFRTGAGNPGEQIRFRSLFSLQYDYPELYEVLSERTESLDVRYSLQQLEFSDGTALRPLQRYSELGSSTPQQPSSPSTPVSEFYSGQAGNG